MFPHSVELSSVLQSFNLDSDLIFQILIDSRFVSSKALKKYCSLLHHSTFHAARSSSIFPPRLAHPQVSFTPNSPTKPLIVVLTRDSARWIEHQINYFKANQFDFLYYIDSNSTDNTVDVISSLGVNYRINDSVSSTFESGFSKILSDLSNSGRWILRLDDDEIISSSTYEYICYLLSFYVNSQQSTFSLSRKWLILDPDHPLPAVSRYQIFLDGDFQNRLFHSGYALPDVRIHTSGYQSKSQFPPYLLPSFCSIYHLDAIVHPLSSRLSKLLRYDSISPGNFTRFKSFYVPENIPLSFHLPLPVNTLCIEHLFLDLLHVLTSL